MRTEWMHGRMDEHADGWVMDRWTDDLIGEWVDG